MLIGKKVEVVGEASNGMETVKQVRELKPNIVSLELDLATMNGIETCRNIKEREEKTGVLFLTQSSSLYNLRDALAAGGDGLVTKDCGFEEFYRALEILMRGKKHFCPCATELIVSEIKTLRKGQSVKSDPPPLTDREVQMIRLLADGKMIKEIAFELGVSNKTVETHVRNIKEKFTRAGLSPSLANLIKFAIREGLTSEHLNPVG